MNELITTEPELTQLKKIPEWYQNLLDDLQKLEYSGIVLTKWAKGKRIVQDELKFSNPEYGSKRVENIAKDLKETTSEVYAWIAFAKQYPIALSDNIRKLSWYYITHTHLIKNRHSKSKPILQLPPGKYNVIYADPPWQYYEGGYKNQSRHYNTMPLDRIKEL